MQTKYCSYNIFVSLITLLVSLANLQTSQAQSNWGSLSGKVVNQKDSKAGIENVLVWLVPEKSQKLPSHPQLALAAKEPVKVSIAKGKFDKKFVTVLTGQKLIIENKDNKGHHIVPKLFKNTAISNSKPQKTQTYVFQSGERIPGKLTCLIQKDLQVPLFVCQHPYFAVTDSSGSFRMDFVPEGKWKFRFWHPHHGYLSSLKATGLSFGKRGDTKIEIKKMHNKLGLLKLTTD